MTEHIVFDVQHTNLAHQISLEFMRETVVIDREDGLRVFEKRIVFISGFQIQRNEAGDPVIAMHNIRAPAQFLNRLDYPFAEEDRTFIIVLKELVFFVVEHGLAMKVIFVINKVDL